MLIILSHEITEVQSLLFEHHLLLIKIHFMFQRLLRLLQLNLELVNSSNKQSNKSSNLKFKDKDQRRFETKNEMRNELRLT